MNIEILKWIPRKSKFRVGEIMVIYGELLLRCDLVIYKNEKLWIRMPEFWFKNMVKGEYVDQKKWFCSWPTKSISDDFQKQVLNKIFEKYGIDLEKAVAMPFAPGKKS